MPDIRRSPGRPRLIDLVEPTDVGILRAAAKLFMEYGYHAVTMEMVAEAAGLTKAAVYYHFHDKTSLLVASMKRTFASAQAASERILSQPKPLTERLEELATVVLTLPQPYVAFDALMREAKADLLPGQVATLREAEASVIMPLEAAVFEAISNGELHVENPLLHVHSFVAALGVGNCLTPDGHQLFPDAANTAKDLVCLFWGGLECRV